MNFTDKLAKDLFRTDFTARDKAHALEQMAALAAQHPALSGLGAGALAAALREREEAVSTGLGGGFAIPHCRLSGLEDFVVLVLVSPKGIDFDALDHRRVHIFIVVFAPEEATNTHLQLLATVSRILAKGPIKKELLETRTADVLYEVWARAIADEDAPVVDERGPKKLLFIILFYEADLDAVLEYLIDQGINGAAIHDAQNMGAYVSAMPLFASFLGFMRTDRHAAKVIMTVIDAGIEQALLRGIEQITGDLNKKQGAMFLSLDISFAKGTLTMI